ncbi:hypothetical protein G5C51_07095 [Streptomyces sp. A7024]|uniref:Uncharacterized protein n=1 Tax=Streptomyces coryli TaxID=1128680 RepID=A0A6G4TV28_9ACTN|nr:hypothetical protein [Streptomyces coryli]
MNAELKRQLEKKVASGERLDRADGIALYESGDLAWLGGLAHGVRTARHGDAGFFGAGDAVEAPLSYGADAGELVDELLALREQEGFEVLVPTRASDAVTGAQTLKTYAVARLLVDTIPHLRTSADADGEQGAKLALQHGADELAGDLSDEDLVILIREAGFRPVERGASYAVVAEHPGPDASLRETPQAMRL